MLAAVMSVLVAVAPKGDVGRAWDKLVVAAVKQGGVDYDVFAARQTELDAVVASVGKASGKLDLAFYLNAYNALVVSSVLRHTKPGRVLDVKGFFDGERHNVAGKSWTLNELETHVRDTFKDPRIHFALNCAAKSCPPLHGRAFEAGSLKRVLDELTKNFLNGPGVQVDEAKRTLLLSKLFEWYKADFTPGVSEFLKVHVSEAKRRAALEAGYGQAFLEYDWRLNQLGR